MSDSAPPPASEQPPRPTHAAAPPETAGASAASTPVPPAPGAAVHSGAPRSRGSYPLSIASLVAGILGIVLAIISFRTMFIPIIDGVLALLLPAAAVVLGFRGRTREGRPAKGLWLTGLILGFTGIAIAALLIVILVIVLMSLSDLP